MNQLPTNQFYLVSTETKFPTGGVLQEGTIFSIDSISFVQRAHRNARDTPVVELRILQKWNAHKRREDPGGWGNYKYSRSEWSCPIVEFNKLVGNFTPIKKNTMEEIAKIKPKDSIHISDIIKENQ